MPDDQDTVQVTITVPPTAVDKHGRLPWPVVWMTTVQTIAATRSADPRLKVCAAVVPVDNTGILSLGYNGDECGGPNTHESPEPGKSNFIHAEINALIKLNCDNLKKKVMYITHFPCRMCCKAMVNAKIDCVVYKDVYRDMSGKEVLDRAGVNVYHIDELIEKMKTHSYDCIVTASHRC